MSGNHHLCPQATSTIVGHKGALASRVRAHWGWAVPLPEKINIAEAGPLHGRRRMQPRIAALQVARDAWPRATDYVNSIMMITTPAIALSMAIMSMRNSTYSIQTSVYVVYLDQVGPVARTVRDCAILYSIIAGRDRRDATTVELPDVVQLPQDDRLSGLRIGIPRQLADLTAVEPGVRAEFEGAIELARELGADVGECDLPLSFEYGMPLHHVCKHASILFRMKAGIRCRCDSQGRNVEPR